MHRRAITIRLLLRQAVRGRSERGAASGSEGVTAFVIFMGVVLPEVCVSWTAKKLPQARPYNSISLGVIPCGLGAGCQPAELMSRKTVITLSPTFGSRLYLAPKER